jgi:hypothetical protein
MGQRENSCVGADSNSTWTPRKRVENSSRTGFTQIRKTQLSLGQGLPGYCTPEFSQKDSRNGGSNKNFRPV